MKTILILIILFPFTLFAQEPKVTLTKDDWAGGICCSSGTRYILRVILDPRNENCFEKSIIKVDNIRLEINEKQFSVQQWNDSVIVFTYEFGINTNRIYGGLENMTVSYYGMTENDIYESIEFVNDVTFIYARKRTKIMKYEFIETYTAYP